MANDNNAIMKVWMPVSIGLGVFSLLTLASGIMAMEEHIGAWVNAFSSFTRPAADILFGWIADYISIELENWMKDYLIVGTVLFAGTTRALIANRQGWNIFVLFLSTIPMLGVVLLVWPLAIAIVTFQFIRWRHWKDLGNAGASNSIDFASSLVIFIAVVILNFIALNAGLPAFQQ